jgi:glycosyltransferase involved in cell wall biosynthesis
LTSIAIVHERFTEFAGSESVVEQLATIYPEAPIYAPIVDESVLPPTLSARRIRHSFAQHLYRGGRGYAYLLPLLPRAMDRIHPVGVDLIVASHHAFANRVALANPGIPVLSYTHTPARWMWQPTMRAGEPGGRVGAALLGGFAAVHRRTDVRAARQCASIIANSTAVADRAQRYWGMNAQVIHPPVDIDFYELPTTPMRGEFLLYVGRLVPYKRPDLAIAVATRLGLPLLVVGDGRMRSRLEHVAGPRVEFLGHVDKARLRELFQTCRALLMPGEEDFGIVPVEAQACGAPVIALGVGGATDIVVPRRTGLLVRSSHLEDWMQTVLLLDDIAFDSAEVRRNAERFDVPTFRRRMQSAIDATVDSHRLSLG